MSASDEGVKSQWSANASLCAAYTTSASSTAKLRQSSPRRPGGRLQLPVESALHHEARADDGEAGCGEHGLKLSVALVGEELDPPTGRDPLQGPAESPLEERVERVAVARWHSEVDARHRRAVLRRAHVRVSLGLAVCVHGQPHVGSWIELREREPLRHALRLVLPNGRRAPANAH